MKPVILFRPDEANQEEFKVAKKYFDVRIQRVQCGKDKPRFYDECDYKIWKSSPQLVVGRYSVLPFYQELENDLDLMCAKLVNSYKQHKWIADFEWYSEPIIQCLTPKTYFEHEICHAPANQAYVVKGKTNSRKFQWNTKMFAKSRDEALKIANELSTDGLIGSQGIIYREYVPLKTFEIGLNDLPFADEWRYFFYKDKLIDYGYYWSIAENADKFFPPPEMTIFAKGIATIVRNYVDFFVLDIARTLTNEYILIEINDGQMSGLSCINPESFYKNLREVF